MFQMKLTPCFFVSLFSVWLVFMPASIVFAQEDGDFEGQPEEQVAVQIQVEIEEQITDDLEAQIEYELEGRIAKYVDGQPLSNSKFVDMPPRARNVSADTGLSSGRDLEDKPIPKRITRVVEKAYVDGGIRKLIESEGRHFRIAGEWILLGDETTESLLLAKGLEVTHSELLPAIGRYLFYIKALKGVSLKELKATLKGEIDGLDYNSIYFEAEGDRSDTGGEDDTRALLKTTPNVNSNKRDYQNVRIGIVDSAIEESHPLLEPARVHVLHLTQVDEAPTEHGTAILSLLAAPKNAQLQDKTQIQGMLPEAEFFCASVFFRTSLGRNGTSVTKLVKAIDWMIQKQAAVINLSLSGPANPLLEEVLSRAVEKGIILVAAAGNDGPLASPVYPAAYPDVIAVTAVSKLHYVYFNANHGDYIDFAALGVNVAHADIKGDMGVSSGTSYAVPIVTAIAANLLAEGRDHASVKKALIERAVDLGPTGKDRTFGYGYIRFE